MRSGIHPEDVSNPKSIVNDYDYYDYVSDCRYYKDCYCMENYGYKRCGNK